MIVFGAIVPHSPLLLPTIGKDQHSKLAKTLAALRNLEEDLYAAKPDTLVLVSPHGSVVDDAFTIFIAPKFQGNLNEFGDFKTTVTFPADLRTIEQIRRLKLQSKPLPLIGVTEAFMDYGAVVPLYFLANHLPNVRVVPIGISHLPIKTHFTVGERIGDVLHQSTRRVALIASADLSHTLTDDAPGGFSPAGKKFDAAVVQSLRKNQAGAILRLESKMDQAKACGLRPITMLLGALNSLNTCAELLAYEGPFGVGYLTARYNLR